MVFAFHLGNFFNGVQFFACYFFSISFCLRGDRNKSKAIPDKELSRHNECTCHINTCPFHLLEPHSFLWWACLGSKDMEQTQGKIIPLPQKLFSIMQKLGLLKKIISFPQKPPAMLSSVQAKLNYCKSKQCFEDCLNREYTQIGKIQEMTKIQCLHYPHKKEKDSRYLVKRLKALILGKWLYSKQNPVSQEQQQR